MTSKGGTNGVSHSLRKGLGDPGTHNFSWDPLFTPTPFDLQVTATKFGTTTYLGKSYVFKATCTHVWRGRTISASKFLGSITYANMAWHSANEFWRWPCGPGVTFGSGRGGLCKKVLVSRGQHFLWPECSCRLTRRMLLPMRDLFAVVNLVQLSQHKITSHFRYLEFFFRWRRNFADSKRELPVALLSSSKDFLTSVQVKIRLVLIKVWQPVSRVRFFGPHTVHRAIDGQLRWTLA